MQGCILNRSLVQICKCESMMVLLCAAAVGAAYGQAGIPEAAWKRPLGLPLENPGKTRTPGDIDDGYW
jgi:hypothetical protein